MMNCEECQIGRYHLISTSYLYRLGTQLIVVSNAPAYICDVCKNMHYDTSFMDNLHYLLDHAGKTLQEGRKAASVREEPTKWQLTRGAENRVR